MSTAQQQRRVVLAEPHEPAGGELATLLNEQGFEVVGHTDDAHAAVALAVALNADLVIVEVPTAAQGLQAEVDEMTAAAVMAGQQVAPVIVLSPSVDRETVHRMVAAGAAGFLRRPLTKAALLPAIEFAIARHAQSSWLRTQLDEVSGQLASRKVIDRAKGQLMTRQGLTEPEAFRWLQRTAMNRRCSMTDIAAEILAQPTATYGV